MRIVGVNTVVLTDSSILGWRQTKRELTLFLEVLLTRLHESFRQFDSTREHGCYRLAEFIFRNVADVRGLSSKAAQPAWNDELGEYRDVFEIFGFSLIDGGVRIDTEKHPITLTCSDCELRVVEAFPTSA